jgi:antitoxin VapB
MPAAGAKTKTEAMRQALEFALALQNDQAPLRDRLRPLQARAAALGPVDPDFDMKAFTDEF